MATPEREEAALDVLIWLVLRGTPEDDRRVLALLDRWEEEERLLAPPTAEEVAEFEEFAKADLTAEDLAAWARIDIEDIIRKARGDGRGEDVC